MAPQVKKSLKDCSTAAGNGGTFLADQGEGLRALSVEIDDTLVVTLGTHYGAHSLGIKRDVKAFHTPLRTVGGDASRRYMPSRARAHGNKQSIPNYKSRRLEEGLRNC
jgi:hypothetical protein